MYECDYIKKEINKWGQMMAKLMELFQRSRTAGNEQQAIAQAEAALAEVLKVPIDKLTAIPMEEIVSTLSQTYQLPDEALPPLADLLYEMARTQEQLGQTEKALLLYRRVQVMYTYLTENEITYNFGWHERLKYIKSKLENA